MTVDFAMYHIQYTPKPPFLQISKITQNISTCGFFRQVKISNFSDKMPNRSCDFCLNVYRKEPSVGYFKLTSFMKIKLGILDVEADYICGLHFDPDSFLENGRLKPNAVPTFFPSKANLLHDHPYYAQGDGGELAGESHEDRQESVEYGEYNFILFFCAFVH